MEFRILQKDKASSASFGDAQDKVSGRASKARAGEIYTPHGIIETPAFVAVGTQATVKSLSPLELKEIGVQLLFGNTYHLHLRPGEDLIKDFGGLASFMQWKGPTITDSGGFQVFSLGTKKIVAFDPGVHARGPATPFPPTHSVNSGQASARVAVYPEQSRRVGDPSSRVTPSFELDEADAPLVKITDDGVTFRSHLDGSLHTFTPEVSIQIQKKLGADLMVAFDECAPHPATHAYTKAAMERTHAWALRCLKTAQSKPFHSWKQALYGIVQGGVYQDLREASAKYIAEQSFDGIAIGGVSVGESKKEMRDALSWTTPFLPEEKPKHLLGIGEIDDIFDAVDFGMDTFDCVIPTRFGRYGIIFVSPKEGKVNNRFRLDINKTRYAHSKEPLDKDCSCNVCKTFTRAYIHHLFKAGELLAYRLASYHNMYFFVHLTKQIRQAILDGQFQNMKKAWIG